MSEYSCRYCGETSEEVDLIEVPKMKVIRGELHQLVEIVKQENPFMCLNCLQGEIEIESGRWPETY